MKCTYIYIMILKMQSSENWSVWCGFLHQQSSRIWWCFGVSLLSCPAPHSASHWCWHFPGSRRGFPTSPLQKRFPTPGGPGWDTEPYPRTHGTPEMQSTRGEITNEAVDGNIHPGGGVRARAALVHL